MTLPVSSLNLPFSDNALPTVGPSLAYDATAATAGGPGPSCDAVSILTSLSNLLPPQQLRSFLQDLQASGNCHTQAQV